MARLLLLGSPQQIESFSARIAADHQLYVPRSHGPVNSGENLIVLDDVSSVTDGFDAVFELSCGDRAEKERNLAMILPGLTTDTLVFINTLTMTATDAASRLGTGSPVTGISFVPAMFADATLLEIAPSMQSPEGATERAAGFLRSLLSIEVEVVEDRVGLVSMRILTMIINEAAFALLEGVASPADIDTAMKLGTNYPEGPLAWADRIGIDVVLAILQSLHEEYQEERYRPSVLLKQHARASKVLSFKC